MIIIVVSYDKISLLFTKQRVKYDARLIKDSTNRTGNTDENELQHYTGSRYFVDDIDDINDNGEECGHYYNDGSTTSNLIHHLATKHKIYKPGSAEDKSFRKLLLSLDEHFEIPVDKSIKLMIGEAFEWNFWTSKARHGYISVTCSWISHDWTLCKTLLALQRVRYPHTSEIIKELLNKIFADWAIASKLLTIITNNGCRSSISDKQNEVEIEVIDLTAVTGHCRKKLITEPIQTKDIVSNIRKLLYNSMFSYWKDIHKVGM
ncbi:zinc finger BED domain-containing protein 1-like [Rhizophagus clarus]|uniref:Zinc finger BED domain-containing protein 1-like n=1 Tax=Rhizophagus clarus TaxID=94130 RepID=A0A8H3MAE6_9GLOM|nr:zinc finger BED domain-containing protein 1-like [Rhizophagus clarus]